MISMIIPTLWMSSVALAFSVDIVTQHETSTRNCRVDELLPLDVSEYETTSPEWSDEQVKAPYGCDCSYSRARYFCPTRGVQGHQTWVPRAVSEGECESMTRFQLSGSPFPPNFRVLFYGNSFIRQVLEGMMCMFQDRVVEKKVKYYWPNSDREDEFRTVSSETTCRGCSFVDKNTIVDSGCISKEDADEGCGCTDNYGEFLFDNGAVVHYAMAGNEQNKSISDALKYHGEESWTHYDTVFANQGNSPYLSREEVLCAAGELQDSSVPFFFLSSYWGHNGDVTFWQEHEKALFDDLGAKHVKINSMTQGIQHLTKGVVENVKDPHFCLPGPPDEMALLLLKITWSVYFSSVV